MTLEFLKALGIEGESADKIIAEAGKETAKYADYDDVKAQLSAANKKIEELGKLDFEGVKKAADEYKAMYEQSVKDSEAKISKMQFDHIFESKLTASKAKSIKAARALFDMDKLKLENGSITGLDEQMAKVMKENPYLFESDEPSPRFSGSSKGNSTPASDDSVLRMAAGLPLKK